MRVPCRIVAFSLMAMMLAARTLDSATVLRLDVSPAISRAPAVLTVRVTVDPDATLRTLTVIAESDTYYRSSEVQLDGDAGAPLRVFEFRDLPSGVYEVTGVVAGADGRHAAVTRLARVEPGVGGR